MADIKIDISVNQRNAQQRIDRLRKSVNQTDKQFGRLNKSISTSGVALGSFVGNIAAAGFGRLVSGIKGLASAAVGTVSELETLSTQFEVLTGSAAEANQIVQELQSFAASTPFQFKDLAKATQRLLSFGFTAEEAKENLVDLGDVSAASGADLSELSLIFGQVAAAGKLTGERLLQFQERAIPIGPALAETLGVAESAVKDLVSNGQVDFKTFERAFKSLNEEGNFAFGGLEKRAQTLEGRFSTLGDNVELLTAKLGSQFGPSIKAITTAVTSFISIMSKSSALRRFGESVGSFLPAAIRVAIDSFKVLTNVVLRSSQIFDIFRSGTTTALSAVLFTVREFVTGFSKLLGAIGIDISGVTNDIVNFQTDIISALDKTAEEFGVNAASTGLSIDEVNKAIEDSANVFENELRKISEESAKQTQKTLDDNKKKKDSIKALTAEEIKAAEEKLKREQDLQQKIANLRQEVKISEEAQRLFDQEEEQIFNDQRLVNLQDFFTREQEATIQANLNAANSEAERQKIILEAQIKGQQLRLAQGQSFVKSEAQLEQERVQNRDRTLQLFSTLARSSSSELAAIGKAAALVQIAIDTQEAIAGAYAFGSSIGGPPLGVAFGGVAAAAQAQRAAQVVGIQGFETGGIVPGSSFTGDNVAANVNSGEMILTRQQQSNLFNMANNGGASGQSQPMNITVQSVLDGEIISESVSQWVANGGQLGEVQ